MKYSEADDVIPSLKRAGVKFGVEKVSSTRTVQTATFFGQLGIRSLGKLDFLRKLGFLVRRLA